MIFLKKNGLSPWVDSAEKMSSLIRETGIIPFFENKIPGYSVEENTLPEYWLTDEELGPWDWKIDVLREGGIAYGKFLLGKSAFATAEWYAHLMNWRRSRREYQPDGLALEVLQEATRQGSIDSASVKRITGLKKSANDALLAGLQKGTWIVISDLIRKYRGPNLEYTGWQTAVYCRPEDIKESPSASDFFFSAEGKDTNTFRMPDCSPEESRHILFTYLCKLTGAPEKTISKYVG